MALGTYQPYAEFDPFTASEWKEQMEMIAPGSGDILSNGSIDSTITMEVIPNNKALITQSKIRSALTFILGYSWCDASSPWKLHRVPPPAHPRYGGQCRPTGLTLQLKTPIGNPAVSNNSPYERADFISDTITKVGRYAEAYITVKFSNQPQQFYTDTDIRWNGKESDRYVDKWTIEPQLEVIDAETELSYVFVTGPPGNPGPPLSPPPPPPIPSAKPIQGRVGERVPKVLFTLQWFQVPQTYICDATTGLPTRFMAANGCVNSEPFLGHGKYTLLMENPKFERFLFPFYSTDGLAFHYTITMPFKQFNPKLGSNQTVVHTDAGWRLFPWRFGGDSTASSGGGVGSTGGAGWYGARRATEGTNPPTASLTNPTVIQEYDFNKLFLNAADPS